MMVVVAVITAVGLWAAQRNLTAAVTRELQSRFLGELSALHNVQDVRHAALAERCRALVRKPRIHAALEDNALDLLYPSAKDELRDVMAENDSSPGSPSHALHAEFYRFLDLHGTVIPPPNASDVGNLLLEEERQLALRLLPREPQLGYLAHRTSLGETVAELIVVPIISTETEETIAALVLGFKPVELGAKRPTQDMRSGIWVNGSLHLPSLREPVRKALASEISQALASPSPRENRVVVQVEGVPHLLFFKRLNPDSLYPPAYEACLFPLTDLFARQRQLRWSILGAGALMLLVGFTSSHFLSARLSAPVEQLAVDSELNRAGRKLAETALEQTNVELQRSVRFSADASHQLKTPVTVLRAGLEELLARENLAPEMHEELSELVHQTYRLTGVIEDLLLLSRMDAGRLQLDLAPVDLSRLIEGELDDLGAKSDTMELSIEANVPPRVLVAGEKRYTELIVRNLLENARKYNRPGGRICVTASEDGTGVLLIIGNTGCPIPASAREHIFERFHRGSAGENVPGHGLGLNLALELARLHGGDVRLLLGSEI
jgi:signal transduction histidine kinase